MNNELVSDALSKEENNLQTAQRNLKLSSDPVEYQAKSRTHKTVSFLVDKERYKAEKTREEQRVLIEEEVPGDNGEKAYRIYTPNLNDDVHGKKHSRLSVGGTRFFHLVSPGHDKIDHEAVVDGYTSALREHESKGSDDGDVSEKLLTSESLPKSIRVVVNFAGFCDTEKFKDAGRTAFQTAVRYEAEKSRGNQHVLIEEIPRENKEKTYRMYTTGIVDSSKNDDVQGNKHSRLSVGGTRFFHLISPGHDKEDHEAFVNGYTSARREHESKSEKLPASESLPKSIRVVVDFPGYGDAGKFEAAGRDKFKEAASKFQKVEGKQLEGSTLGGVSSTVASLPGQNKSDYEERGHKRRSSSNPLANVELPRPPISRSRSK